VSDELNHDHRRGVDAVAARELVYNLYCADHLYAPILLIEDHETYGHFPAKCITQTDFPKDVAVMANSGAESSFAGSLRSKRQPPNDLT
jgi:hypothetical protein